MEPDLSPRYAVKGKEATVRCCSKGIPVINVNILQEWLSTCRGCLEKLWTLYFQDSWTSNLSSARQATWAARSHFEASPVLRRRAEQMTSRDSFQPWLSYDCNSPEKYARSFSLIKDILKIAKLSVSIIAYVEQAHFDSKLSVFQEAASKNNPRKPIYCKCYLGRRSFYTQRS